MNKKILSLCIASTMLLSALPTTVLAASVGSTDTDKSVGSDSVQNQQTQYADFRESNAETEVYLTVDDSELLVSVPTTLILSGTPTETGEYIAKYSVAVKGDMSGDKTVTVEPESDTVLLNQVGKNSISANIYQDQTDFDTDDFKNETVTNGSVVAQSLTAGSWNGEVDFLINVNKMSHYYSTLALALDDINNSTIYTENSTADLTDALSAACSVYKSGSTYKIEVLKDLTDVPMLNINQDTKLDLNNHTLKLAEGNRITSIANFSVINGTIEAKNSNMVIYENVADKDFSLYNVNLIETATTTNAYSFASKAKKNYISNCNLTAVTTDPTKYSLGAYFVNTAGEQVLKDANITVNGGAMCWGINCSGNSAIINNVNINASTNLTVSSRTLVGISLSELPLAKLNEVSVVVNGTSTVPDTSIVGIIASKGTAHVYNDVDIEVNNNSGKCVGYGLLLGEVNDLLLNNSVINYNVTSGGTGTGLTTLSNTTGVLNDCEIAVKCSSKDVAGVNIIENSDITLNNCSVLFENNDINAQNQTGYTGNCALASNSTVAINGGYYSQKLTNENWISAGNDAAGGAIHNTGTMILTENIGSLNVVGSNCAVGNLGNLTVYGGTFSSPNHGGLYCDMNSSNVTNIYGGKFYNSATAGEYSLSGVTAYGGMYSSGAGTLNVENATIIGGNHGFRQKDGAVNTTFKNTHIEGQNDVFSVASGTLNIGEGVTVKSKTGRLVEANPAGTINDPNNILGLN